MFDVRFMGHVQVLDDMVAPHEPATPSDLCRQLSRQLCRIWRSSPPGDKGADAGRDKGSWPATELARSESDPLQARQRDAGIRGRGRSLPFILVAIALLVGAFPLAAQGPADPGVLRSRSGQFVVARSTNSRKGGVVPSSTDREEDAQRVDLEPGTLVLTCERVRRALLRELQQPDRWQGRIYVIINPQLPQNSPALIAAQNFNQGWHYRVELPPSIETAKLVRGVTHVLLMEFANRTHPARSAAIPLWLLEGFTQHLLNSALVDLVVRPPLPSSNPVPFRRTSEELAGYDPLSASRERLGTHAALSFSRMAEVTGDDLAAETWATFQASAHVFFNRLLQIPGARASLSHMLSDLPYHLNWQTAFFNRFQPVFVRLLDVEKWWSVVLVQFTGHDPLNAWSMSVALDKLDQVLTVPVLVSDNRQGLANRRKVTVQELLEKWGFLSQQTLVQGVVNQLNTCRLKMPPELLELADGYQEILRNYLADRAQAGRARSLPGLPKTTADLLVRGASKKLDRLDEHRNAFRSASEPTIPQETATVTE